MALKKVVLKEKKLVLKKGVKQEKLNIARTLKTMVMSVEQIVAATGLSPEEIENA